MGYLGDTNQAYLPVKFKSSRWGPARQNNQALGYKNLASKRRQLDGQGSPLPSLTKAPTVIGAVITLMVGVQDSAQCQSRSTMQSSRCMHEAETDLKTGAIRSKIRVALV